MTRTQTRMRRLLTAPLMAAALVVAAGCSDDAGSSPESDEDTGAEQEDGAGDLDETGDEDGADDQEESGDEGAITLAEVEENDSPDSCWAVIDGTVYDLTDWIGRHPGGADRIEQLCGTDATELFTQQHGGSQGPEGQLENFEIGTLEG
ncbi:cytochrome b5 domain-containing protein [Bogoriella caseilytica]|uniref:Cytochrome b5-like protein n=1 Tax=Bogoriella caseilytica TaxID=56055 RepID=A0A3N2BB78_9MICO|nr:cytochrome b5-like heme/steroid binding domain-containing protein [Bogoriella caseilytica]ROR72509.1 cytochrome b5-like protein [Bogoriella caseilytica]